MSAFSIVHIRPEQVRGLHGGGRGQYAQQVVAVLRGCMHDRVRHQPDAKLLARIEAGIDRAASYDIKGKRGVFKYVCLMVLYGDDFDRDPRLPWARKILDEQERHAVLAKADWLFEVGRREHPAFVASARTAEALDHGR